MPFVGSAPRKTAPAGAPEVRLVVVKPDDTVVIRVSPVLNGSGHADWLAQPWLKSWTAIGPRSPLNTGTWPELLARSRPSDFHRRYAACATRRLQRKGGHRQDDAGLQAAKPTNGRYPPQSVQRPTASLPITPTGRKRHMQIAVAAGKVTPPTTGPERPERLKLAGKRLARLNNGRQNQRQANLMAVTSPCLHADERHQRMPGIRR
jgi:hypothetical protein